MDGVPCRKFGKKKKTSKSYKDPVFEGVAGSLFFSLLRCSILKQHINGHFHNYRGQPKAGTGHKIQFVPFVFSKSRFHGPVFRCDKIVVIVTLL